MGIVEKIEELIRKEVDRRMIETMHKLVPIICRDHPETFMVEQVWKDLGKIDEIYKTIPPPLGDNAKRPRCKGVTKCGKSCMRTIQPGQEYCHNHKDQVPPPPPPKPKALKKAMEGHNHDESILFSKNCPTCIKNRRKNKHSGFIPHGIY